MKTSALRSYARVLFALLVITPALLVAGQVVEKKDKSDDVIALTPFEVSTGLGATPGGAQDINYVRLRAERGVIPHPSTITAEGLFSEHDLPLELGATGESLLRVQTAATTARFEVLPAVRYLAQLGFSSGLSADTWRRRPLNLVAVVDKSGSMAGEPLTLVRASLKSALRYLRDGDQLSIVLYGDRAHIHLSPTPIRGASRAVIRRQIDEIESMGSTAMEAGLHLGYQVARESAAEFDGITRVMLFTDEQPNVGNTDAESFMAMAGAAAVENIGLTTIGVGVQFGAELATKISAVRGGNLFFFGNSDEMRKAFAEDFDTMVTELAQQLTVRIAPARGLRMAGVFGVPSELLRWDGDAIVLDVATIFLSRRKGAIYFALATDDASSDLPARVIRAGEPLAEVGFSYRNAADRSIVKGRAVCTLLAPRATQLGLVRGARLVDEYLTLKQATQSHVLKNDQETAYRLVRGLLTRLEQARDMDLDREHELVRRMHDTLATLSGHASESRPRKIKAGPRSDGSWESIPPFEQRSTPVDFLSGLPARANVIRHTARRDDLSREVGEIDGRR